MSSPNDQGHATDTNSEERDEIKLVKVHIRHRLDSTDRTNRVGLNEKMTFRALVLWTEARMCKNEDIWKWMKLSVRLENGQEPGLEERIGEFAEDGNLFVEAVFVPSHEVLRKFADTLFPNSNAMNQQLLAPDVYEKWMNEEQILPIQMENSREEANLLQVLPSTSSDSYGSAARGPVDESMNGKQILPIQPENPVEDTDPLQCMPSTSSGPAGNATLGSNRKSMNEEQILPIQVETPQEEADCPHLVPATSSGPSAALAPVRKSARIMRKSEEEKEERAKMAEMQKQEERELIPPRKRVRKQISTERQNAGNINKRPNANKLQNMSSGEASLVQGTAENEVVNRGNVNIPALAALIKSHPESPFKSNNALLLWAETLNVAADFLKPLGSTQIVEHIFKKQQITVSEGDPLLLAFVRYLEGSQAKKSTGSPN
ncbi:unnamed protein product [Caenorhabditis sp. 36 PRJEB53466]|nr:unnamed protein product [Caenorhabditis sp. 36 PRJEB53466]